VCVCVCVCVCGLATVIAHNHGPIKCKCMTVERQAFAKARLVAAENASRKKKMLLNENDIKSCFLIHAMVPQSRLCFSTEILRRFTPELSIFLVMSTATGA
jgi:hypothetical protein